MNSDKSEAGPGGGGTLHDAHVPVRMPRESFRAFSRKMDDQLAQLVARWIHTAAPCSLRPSTRRSKRQSQA